MEPAYAGVSVKDEATTFSPAGSLGGDALFGGFLFSIGMGPGAAANDVGRRRE